MKRSLTTWHALSVSKPSVCLHDGHVELSHPSSLSSSFSLLLLTHTPKEGEGQLFREAIRLRPSAGSFRGHTHACTNKENCLLLAVKMSSFCMCIHQNRLRGLSRKKNWARPSAASLSPQSSLPVWRLSRSRDGTSLTTKTPQQLCERLPVGAQG